MTGDSKLLPLRIRLPYGSEEEFVEKYGANVARSGVFIATRAVKAEGTALAFEFVLADGTRLMRGEGVVARAHGDGASGGRSGMTVRFVRLDAATKAFIDRLLARRAAAGASPGEAPRSSPAGAAPSSPALPPAGAEHAAASGATPARAADAPGAGAVEAPSAPAGAPGGAAVDEVPSALRALAGGQEAAREERSQRRTLRDITAVPPPAESLPETDLVVGLDVGARFARAAVFHEGRVRPVPLEGGATLLPAALAPDPTGGWRTGAAALAPGDATAGGVVPLLGVRPGSARLRPLAERLLLPLAPEEDTQEAGLHLGGRRLGSVEATGLLLGELRVAAERLVGGRIRRAVLAVPAHFTAHQRAALREAGERAGLSVLRMLEAPSAAALAYAQGRGLARKRVLVLDVGASASQASVVELTGDDAEVVTSGADATLGGVDFDARVAGLLAAASPEVAAAAPAALRAAAEAAKVALGVQPEVSVPLAGATPVVLTRQQVEAATAELVERVVGLVQGVLEAGGLSAQGLDAVVLVGGQSRSPHLRRRLEEHLGRPLHTELEAQGAGALGAALLGHALREEGGGQPAASVSEVLAVPLGVADRGGGLQRLLERNTRLPAHKSLTLEASAAGPLVLAFYQGPSAVAEEDDYLGALHLDLERSGEVQVHLELSADGALGLAATLPGGKRQPVALAADDPGPAGRAALVARSPLVPAPPEPPRPGGLLGGLRRLFGKR